MSETRLTAELLDSYEGDARETNLVEVSSPVLLSLIAAARELEAAKAQTWDEGYEACLYDTNTGATSNPYRLPKGPTK